MQAVLTAAEAGNFYKKQGKDLVDVLNELYAKHGTFKETQIALSKAGAAGAARIKEIMDNLRKDAPQDIGGVKVVKLKTMEIVLVLMEQLFNYQNLTY